jgi:putative FmdB family regulatory protein
VPIYEYRCDDCGVTLEVLQRMSDDPLETCEECGGHLSKVLHPVAIHFKGSGFYTTDYGKGSGRPAGGSSGDDAAAKDDKAASASSDTARPASDAPKSGDKAAKSGDKAAKSGMAKEKQKAT